MCKVLAITNTKKLTQWDFKKLITVSQRELKSQRDGFGWVAQNDDFSLVGERTTNVEKFESFLERPLLDLPFIYREEQNSFGTLIESEPPRAFLAHGRISTNNKAILNTHPINRLGWSLIHNGVVTHHGPGYVNVTDNDSEHVLHNLQTGGIEAVAENLTGYYAFCAFDPNGVLHIGRDAIAPLFVTWVPKIESFIYGTTKELIKEVISGMMWGDFLAFGQVLNDVYIQHHPDGTITHKAFVSRGRDKHSSDLAELSLGKKLPFNVQKNSYWSEMLGKWVTEYADDRGESSSVTTGPRSSSDEVARKAKTETTTSNMSSLVEEALRRASAAGKKITKRERNKMQIDLINDARGAHEKHSLKQYFKFIKETDPKDIIVFDKFGRRFDSEVFRGLSPEQQIAMDVSDIKGQIIDPYFWDSTEIDPRALEVVEDAAWYAQADFDEDTYMTKQIESEAFGATV